jgi:hypothetical protein
MGRIFQLSALLALLSGAALADAIGDAQVRVVQLENQWAQLDAGRVRLERDSSQLAGEIERVKAEPDGVRRDFRLRELLASAKSKADELTQVAAQERALGAPLSDARRALITNCDRLLSQNLNEARRLEVARLRTAQAALLAMPTAPLGPLGSMGKVAVDPLDGPRELKEKADLLRDSGDKLKREVARLAARIDDVERRRHLRERAGAVDEDWFGEAVSNRKFARTSTIASASDAKTQTPAAPAQTTPQPGISGGGSTGSGTTGAGGFGAPPGTTVGGNGAPGGMANTPSGNFDNSGGGHSGESGGFAPAARATDSTVLRNLVDPSTLDELRRSDGGDDLERQVRALKRAQGELEGLAAELERRARSLSTRADELKKQK